MSVLGYVRDYTARHYHSTRWGDGELLRTPHLFADGDPVVILATPFDDNAWTLSDRALIADRLTDAHIDLTTGTSRNSWEAVRASLPQRVLTDVDPWELVTTATTDTLGEAVTDLTTAMLQADALRMFSSHARPRSFTDRLIQRAGRFESGTSQFKVVPRAKLPNRFGGQRQVSLMAEGPRGRRYILGVNKASNSSYDRAIGTFNGVEGGTLRASLVAVVAQSAKLPAWQFDGLHAVCRPVLEEHLDEEFAALTQ